MTSQANAQDELQAKVALLLLFPLQGQCHFGL